MVNNTLVHKYTEKWAMEVFPHIWPNKTYYIQTFCESLQHDQYLDQLFRTVYEWRTLSVGAQVR